MLIKQASAPVARSGPKPAARPARGNIRRKLVQVHLWLGVVLGLLWAVQGLTGSLLVFHREFDRIADGQLTSGAMAPIESLVAEATRVAGRPIQRITVVGDDSRVLEARYDDANGHPQAVRLDAATARVVGHRDRDPSTPFAGSAWRWIYLVHNNLLAGDTGKTLIGISGLFLLVSIGLGAYIGWPKRGQWRAAFAVTKWRTLLQKFYGWHRALGLASLAVVMLLSFTGAYMVFDSSITSALGRIMAYEPIATMAHHRNAAMEGHVHAAVGPDEALATARSVFPAGKFMNIELPQEHPDHYSIRFTVPGEWRTWSGRAIVRVDPATGAVLAQYDPLRAPPLNRFDDVAYPIHLGEAAGLTGRILAVLAGLSLPVFYVTGITLWWRKRRTRAKSRRANP